MSQERRERAKAILRSAIARSPDERGRFLAEACRDDPTLRADVEVLLQSYEKLRGGIDPEGDTDLGRKIGKYEVLERIGQGAMGVVYKARDPLMRRIVAIKTMSAEIASDPELHERFYREARSAGNLSHRNIITIYDLGEEGRRPFIAMEFLAGEDLKTKLDRRAKLTLEERLRWMRETLEGLDHAHRKDLIHRDIKPANIFITREGEVKVLDFGLARLSSSVATKSGLVMGTPSYMSPEQVRGEKLDPRSDLFSAGATFYELLSYRKPFAGDTIHGVFFKILETSPEPLTELNPLLPVELVDIIKKAMAKDLGSRYASAEAALQDLRRLETALPEKKRALRAEALEALGRVESLLESYRGNLDREAPQQVLLDGRTVSLPVPGALPGEDPDEAPTLNELLPSDFLGLAATIARANDDARRLEAAIRNLEAARELVANASGLESRGEDASALANADEALGLVPSYLPAASCADRLSRRFAERDPRFQAARIEALLREGEARLRAGAFAFAAERAHRVLALDPGNARARKLTSEVEAELERERREREARERAFRLVTAARDKLAQDDDPDGCLSLLDQAFELDPEDSDAQALKEKAENRRAHLRSLAVEETAMEAIASATLAARRGELDLAARELARARIGSAEATEVAALTLLLERARASAPVTRDSHVETETQRKRESLAAPPQPARLRPRTPGRPARASLSPWLMGAVSTVIAVLLGVLGWRAMAPSELGPAPAPVESTSTSVSETRSLPMAATTVAPPATIVPATTTVRSEPSSTPSTMVTTSVSSTIPTSTTSSILPSTTTTEAPTTITTSTAVEAPLVRPEEQIAELLRRYEAAYETLDVNALGAIYPTVPLSVKTSFQNFKSLDLRMEPITGPEVSRSTAGPTASAVYRLVQTVEPKVGKTTVSRHRATFLFAGVGSAWIIVRVDFQEDK